MEEHRLKPMQKGYNEKLFNQIYKDTEQLRKKLSYQIDARRFGYDQNEILSWFDVKFIFSFNKYYGTMTDELLKANIIKSLQFYKNRILRLSYSLKNQVNNNTIDILELYDIGESNTEPDYEFIDYLKNHLSREAYMVLEVQLNPPLYIIEKLNDNNRSLTKIPNQLIADYFGLGVNSVSSLKREIKACVTELQVGSI